MPDPCPRSYYHFFCGGTYKEFSFIERTIIILAILLSRIPDNLVDDRNFVAEMSEILYLRESMIKYLLYVNILVFPFLLVSYR